MNGLERLMIDCSSTMMLLVDPADLRIVIGNAAAQRTLGYPREQLEGMAITAIESSLQDVFYWEDVANGQHLEIDAQEGLYQCSDGALVTVVKSIRIIEHEGRSLLLVQANDMRRAQAVEDTLAQTLSQLRATLESTANGILVVDWHGKIASMNRLFARMWALPATLVEGGDDQAIFDFIAGHVIESATCRQRLAEIVGGDETEDLFQLADGRYFEARSRPQYLGEHIVGRVFGFTDITERKLAEEALRDSRDKLEERVAERTAALQMANAALETRKAQQDELIDKLEQAQSQLLQSEKMATIGQLAAGVAHEINNPVGFVSSNLNTLQRYADDLLRLLAAYEAIEAAPTGAGLAQLQLIKTEVDPAFLREDIGMLLAESLDGVRRVTSIVQDLKDFSHVDAAERLWADLEAGLDSTLRLVDNELKYKAEVVREYGGIPQVECLASQLNQVFMNLLVNAAHAIKERGRITIRTRRCGDTVHIEFEDNGGGIAPQHLDRIFEPFFTTKPVGQGTGLGLSLSYGIVQKHGGRIDVRSEVGRGTVFTVVLPHRERLPASAA